MSDTQNTGISPCCAGWTGNVAEAWSTAVQHIGFGHALSRGFNIGTYLDVAVLLNLFYAGISQFGSGILTL